jgi:hypothetical protein
MSKDHARLIVTIVRGKKVLTAEAPLHGVGRLVFVINEQFTNAPNTTQIASGAGRSSASGSNAAILSPDTFQQEAIGAGGLATNRGIKGKKSRHRPLPSPRRPYRGKSVIFILNDQVVKLPRSRQNASATQIASGAGAYSTGGTNSAIESPRTRQQQAVGGGSGGRGVNKETAKNRHRKNGKGRSSSR